MLNTYTENKFQLLVQDEWEDWIVLSTKCKGAARTFKIVSYEVGRLKDESEHILPYEKVIELYKDNKLRLCTH
jgi:hypothetical protein